MVRPALRSRSLRRVKKKTTSGRHVIHYERRRPSKPICGSCGKPLSGVARGRAVVISKLSKTQKRPTRPYGGNLCSECSRETIKAKLFK